MYYSCYYEADDPETQAVLKTFLTRRYKSKLSGDEGYSLFSKIMWDQLANAGREFESWQDFEMVTHNAWFELGKEGRNHYKWISRYALLSPTRYL